MNENTTNDTGRVFERPDGYYWIEGATGKEYGPFTTIEEASLDMDYKADSDYEPGETLEEAEDELGISDWVDPDTGELAEGLTHLEDH
ncbi:MAG: hypothetical protein PHU46_13665 [Rhodocyclaceae bacterium]|nr:hypothetical protein [Rhodocyclaceae bacterium]